MQIWREVQGERDYMYSGFDDRIDCNELQNTQGILNILFIDLHIVSMELVTF